MTDDINVNDLIRRDPQYTVPEQLSRLFVYAEARQVKKLMAHIDWASDAEKLTAARNHAVMTANS